MALCLAGCSEPRAAPPATVGKVGSTLQAAGVQITLDNVILDPAGQLAVTVLTLRNTSTATASYSTLSVASLLSDTKGHTYSPDANSGAIVPACATGLGSVRPARSRPERAGL